MIARSFAFATALFMAAGSVAFALDQSTRDVGPRNPVELCCVDTALLPLLETSIAPDRQALLELNHTTSKTGAKPGLDGADWNCRRPDGSRRCFSSLRGQ